MDDYIAVVGTNRGVFIEQCYAIQSRSKLTEEEK